jgi:hypothetical protein
MTDTAIERRDEAIAEAIANGRSLQAVRKQFRLSAAEIDDVLEKVWPVDLRARMRMIKRDVGRIDRLVQVFFEKALAGDVPSGLLVVRIWERLHELCGMNAAAKIELIQAPREAPTSYERITDVIINSPVPTAATVSLVLRRWMATARAGQQQATPAKLPSLRLVLKLR